MEMRIESERLLVIRIRSILRRAEFDECQRAAAEMIRKFGRVTGLIVLDGFRGWQQGEDWGDVSFLLEHESNMEKLAVLMFAGAGLRSNPLRYFNDEASARSWLASAQS
jgi:hypothetical protein